MKNFRLYANSKGWEHIITTENKARLNKEISKLNSDKYYSYMVIQHDFDKDCDELLEMNKVLHKS